MRRKPVARHRQTPFQAAFALSCVAILTAGTAWSSPVLAGSQGQKARGSAAISKLHHARNGHSAEGSSGAAPQTPPGIVVNVANRQLIVRAADATLADVMARIAQVGSVQVSGPVPSAVVNGQYGPGSPAAVLAELLEAGHSSYVLGGHTADGLPRTVVFLGTVDDAPAAAGRAPLEASRAPAAADEPAGTSEADTPGPGAVVHVPPNEAPGADNPEAAPERVQRVLQRLQQIENQQQDQAAPQP